MTNVIVNDPITELKAEHQAVKLALSILEKIAIKLTKNEPVELAQLDQILEFLTTFVDQCHHSKEEELLLPALEKIGVAREGGPIGIMLQEHDGGRKLVKGLRQGVADLKNGDLKAVAQIVSNIRNYSNILNKHIYKEDNMLYPIAAKALTTEQIEQLTAGFAAIEEQKVGAGKHEEFHRLLDQLQQIYLK